MQFLYCKLTHSKPKIIWLYNFWSQVEFTNENAFPIQEALYKVFWFLVPSVLSWNLWTEIRYCMYAVKGGPNQFRYSAAIKLRSSVRNTIIVYEFWTFKSVDQCIILIYIKKMIAFTTLWMSKNVTLVMRTCDSH